MATRELDGAVVVDDGGGGGGDGVGAPGGAAAGEGFLADGAEALGGGDVFGFDGRDGEEEVEGCGGGFEIGGRGWGERHCGGSFCGGEGGKEQKGGGLGE